MLQVSELHRQAGERLQSISGDPKKTALVHTAIALGASFLMTVMNYLFSQLISNTGGLDGLGTRSALSTLQAMLELAVMIALPFWQMGIYYAALQWEKGNTAGFSSLLQGFRRFGSVLGMLFLRGVLFFALGIVVINIGTAVFMMTPLATPIIEIFSPIMEQGVTPEQLETLLTPELMESAFRACIPLIIALIVLYVIALIPIFYRVRLADFCVMEGLTGGKSLLKSFVITGKHCLQLCRLDLSFWWFYALQALSVAVCYGDAILPAIGVSLPISGVSAELLFYALGSVCQIALLWRWEAYRVTSYALAYRTLTGPAEDDSSEMPS